MTVIAPTNCLIDTGPRTIFIASGDPVPANLLDLPTTDRETGKPVTLTAAPVADVDD
jgi:hypothetical protein